MVWQIQLEFHGVIEGGVGDGVKHTILAVKGFKVGEVINFDKWRLVDKRLRRGRARNGEWS